MRIPVVRPWLAVVRSMAVAATLAGIGALYPSAVGAMGGVPPEATQSLTPTTTTLSVLAPDPVGFLQPIFLGVIVTAGPGTAPPGTVSFFDGSTLVGVLPLRRFIGSSVSIANLTVNGLAPGLHTFSAAYSGSPEYAPSATEERALTIASLERSTFTVLIPPPPAPAGARVPLVALVLPWAGPAPSTGFVLLRFNDEGFFVPVIDGVAQTTSPPLTAGVHYLRADAFLDDRESSVSPYVSLTAYSGAPPTATSLQLAASPPASQLGDPVTFTVTVSGTGTPTGGVIVLADGNHVGSGAVVTASGVTKADITVTGLSRGIHVINVLFHGTGGFASAGLTTTHIVQ